MPLRLLPLLATMLWTTPQPLRLLLLSLQVLHHMAHSTGCRGLFATHYHHLAREHAHDPRVAIMHMACAVSEPQEGQGGGSEEVTFLYKLSPGGWVAVAAALGGPAPAGQLALGQKAAPHLRHYSDAAVLAHHQSTGSTVLCKSGSIALDCPVNSPT